jgi:hypothetical protein
MRLFPPLVLLAAHWNTRGAMLDRDHTSDAAPELAGVLARHPGTAWLDALVVELAGTLRGKRYLRDDMTREYEWSL